MAQAARGRIAQIYLHWTAGRYGQVYDDYHLNIDADGTIYCTCDSLTEQKSHTWKRNSGSIGIALCCGLGALANHGHDADLGVLPPPKRKPTNWRRYWPSLPKDWISSCCRLLS